MKLAVRPQTGLSRRSFIRGAIASVGLAASGAVAIAAKHLEEQRTLAEVRRLLAEINRDIDAQLRRMVDESFLSTAMRPESIERINKFFQDEVAGRANWKYPIIQEDDRYEAIYHPSVITGKLNPIVITDLEYGPIDKAVLVRSFEEFRARFGYPA